MVYAYRLKNTSEEGRVIEGFTIRRTWQFSSDSKIEILEKWPMIVLLKAENIKTAREKIDIHDKESRNTVTEQKNTPVLPTLPSGENPLHAKLHEMSLTDLKQFAKDNGFDEAEYSKLTRSSLIEYLYLGMSEKK